MLQDAYVDVHKEGLYVEPADPSLSGVVLAYVENIPSECHHCLLCASILTTIPRHVALRNKPRLEQGFYANTYPVLHDPVPEGCGEYLAQLREGNDEADARTRHVLPRLALLHQPEQVGIAYPVTYTLLACHLVGDTLNVSFNPSSLPLFT